MTAARAGLVALAVLFSIAWSPGIAGAGGLGGAATDGEGIDYGAISGGNSPGSTGTGASYKQWSLFLVQGCDLH